MQIIKNSIFSEVFKSIQSIGRGLVLIAYLFPSIMIHLLSLSIPIVLLQIYDRIIPNQSYDTLKMLVFGACAAILLEILFKILRARVATWQAACFEYRMYYDLFKRLLEAPLSKILLRTSGELINEFNLIKLKKDLLGGGQLLMALVDIPFVIIYLVLIFLIGHYLVLIPIVALGLMFLSMVLMSQKSRKLIQEKNQLDDRKFNFINEVFHGLHTIKTHAMESLMLRRYERLQMQHAKMIHATLQHQFTLQDYYQLISQLALVVMVTLGVYQIINAQSTLGIVAACMLLTSRTTQPIVRLMALWENLQRILEDSTRYHSIISMQQAVDLSKKQSLHIQGQIQFRNVTIGYGQNVLFEHLNWDIESGECVYLTGPGFSGKTTLLKLVTGEIIPTVGQIFIDGKPISAYPELAQRMSYIGPDTTLFQGTIIENLNGFDGMHKIEKINVLLTQFGLNPFIQKLPKGLHTELSNQSIDFIPKGIKQRLILLRTMLQNPKIILFDEANINLDRAADQFITHFLSTLRGKVTTIIVSHRPSLRKIATKICVIQHRQVVSADE